MRLSPRWLFVAVAALAQTVKHWWRLRPQHKRYDNRIRYALSVTLETAGANLDIFTPISLSVAQSVSI